MWHKLVTIISPSYVLTWIQAYDYLVPLHSSICSKGFIWQCSVNCNTQVFLSLLNSWWVVSFSMGMLSFNPLVIAKSVVHLCNHITAYGFFFIDFIPAFCIFGDFTEWHSLKHQLLLSVEWHAVQANLGWSKVFEFSEKCLSPWFLFLTVDPF